MMTLLTELTRLTAVETGSNPSTGSIRSIKSNTHPHQKGHNAEIPCENALLQEVTSGGAPPSLTAKEQNKYEKSADKNTGKYNVLLAIYSFLC